MKSLLLFYGMATLIYSVAPNDIDNQLIFHLFIGDSTMQVPLRGVTQCFASLAKNLVATARIFERQVRAFSEVLLGLPLASLTRKARCVCTRKKGLFRTGWRIALAASVADVEVCIFMRYFGEGYRHGCWIWCAGTVI